MNVKELLSYWRIIKKRLWLIGLLVMATLGAMLIISYLSKPLYRATTSFQVTAPLPAGVPIFEEYRLDTSRGELGYTRNNFLQVLQSEFVVSQIIEELELDIKPEELLTERIVIEADETSDFVKLTVTAESPEMAAAIANVLVDRASRQFGALSAGALTSNREFMRELLEKTKEELDHAKATLVQFQIENRFGSLEALLSTQQSLLIDLKLDRDTALAKGEQVSVLMYEEIIAQRERELQDMLLLTLEADTLESEVKRIEATYRGLVDRETEAQLKENEILSAKFIQVIPASKPGNPLPRFNITLLIVGTVVSFIVGVILAFLLEALHDLSPTAGKDEKVLSRETILGAPAD